MPDDKKSMGAAKDDSLTPDEQHTIEVKVDNMLDPRRPDDKSAAKETKGDKTPPPLNIFTDPQTAPEVPEEVMKTMVEPEPGEEPTPKERVLKITDAADVPEPRDTPSDSDDNQTDAAVDDISKHEGDEILAAQDAEVARAFEPTVKHSFNQKVKQAFSTWWHNKKARYATFGGIVAVLIVLALVPMTRAFALNLFGMRATAQLTVLDDTTQLPLKNVQVSLGGATAVSDSRGSVTLKHVRLGSQDLHIQKVAFATVDQHISVGLGSNDLGNIALKAVGTQYSFKVTDYTSGKPVTSAEATSGEANAEADSKGMIILTVKDPNSQTLQVSISADGYQTAQVSVAVGSTAVTAVQLVSSHKEVYISKQSGKYDLYAINVDGTGKKVLLPATGSENSQLELVVSPDGSEAALVSTRDNVRDSDGYLLQALTLVNIASGSSVTIDHSERIQIIDWIGDRLVYAMAKAGASAANPSRYQLMSYDYTTNQRLQLDHANYFNDLVSAKGVIYYATSNQYAGGVSQFNRVNPDGTGKQTLLTNEVWNIFRTSYTDFSLSSATGWYTYSLGDSKPQTTATAYNGTSRDYIDSPDGKHSVWVDNRDGKGALIVYDTTANKDRTLLEQSGLKYPVRWLNNSTLIYRVSTPQETADYVVSLGGTSGKKITDVTDAAGLGLWYYY